MYSFQISLNTLSFYNFFIFCFLMVLFLISFIISKHNPTFEKLSAYECGFEAFSDTKEQHDMKYFMIGLFFILFDIELIFLFPWVNSLNFNGNFNYILGMDFLIELSMCYMLIWYFYIFDWN